MAKYRIETDKGSYEVETDETASPAKSAPAPDALETALNYHTGNNLIDAPLGVLQGAGKGVLSTAVTGGSMIRSALGMPQLDPRDVQLLTKPDGIGQGTGKFLEQGAEYGAGSGVASATTRGAGLLAKTGAQALASAGVAGLQTGGDPKSMAWGGALGAGGELAGAAISGVKSLSTAKAPNLENYSTSFAAVPTQKTVINRALPTLVKDGIQPGANPLEMQGAVKSRLTDLGRDYEALPKDIGTRTIDPQTVITGLKKQQDQYVRNGVVTSANKPYFNHIQNEIDDTIALAGKNGGLLSFDDLKHLRNGANGRTNFASPDADINMFKDVGNVYRKFMDYIAPETTPLNRDWATYSSLETLVDKNVSYGRGTTESGLTKSLNKWSNHAAGTAIGAGLGHLTGIPGAEVVGGIIGGVAYPKIAEPVAQALKNSVENGQFVALSKGTQMAIKAAAQVGDNKTVMRLLGGSLKTAVNSGAKPNQ